MSDWRPPTIDNRREPEHDAPPPVAAPARRVAAGLIDLVPVIFIALALSDREATDDGFAANLSGGSAILALGLVLAYSFVSEALTGTTLGKWLLGLTVIDAGERRPGIRAVAVRTVVRPLDALPVCYLVGLVVMLATPGKQRIGDLVAKTRVVQYADVRATAPRTKRAAGVLGVVAALALGIGTVAWAATGGSGDADDRVGAFDYERDVVPIVDRTMDVLFRERSADDLAALFAPGAATPEEIEKSLEQVGAGVGTLDGQHRIVDHEVFDDRTVPGLAGRVDIAEVRVEATFENGAGQVLIAIADVNGELRLLSWYVNLV